MSDKKMEETSLRWALPAAAVCMIAGVLLGRVCSGWLLPVSAVLCALLSVFVCQGKWRIAAACVLTGCIGCLCGQIACHPALPAEGSYVISGVVCDEIMDGERDQHKTALCSVTLDGKSFPTGAYWTWYGEKPEALQPGSRVTMTAKVYHPSGMQNPHGFDFREYLLAQGITIGVYGEDELTIADCGFHLRGQIAKLRHRLMLRLKEALGEETGSLAAAMLLGIRSLAAEEDMEAFRNLGIAHVLSVSGYHVAIVAWLLMRLLGKTHLPRFARVSLLAGVLFIYCLLTGSHVPVVRASVLLVTSEMLGLYGRQRQGIHMLSLTAIILLLMNPAQLTSAGFQLTMGAMLGIYLCQRTILTLLFHGAWAEKKLWQAVTVSLCAQIGVLLPQLYWFHELPLFSLAANVALLGYFTLLLSSFWAMLPLLLCVPLARLVGSGIAWVNGILMNVVRLLGSQSWLTLWTKQANLLTLFGWAAVLLGLYLLGRKHRKIFGMAALCGAAVVVLSLIPLPHSGTEYIQLSVGNADSAILHDGNQVVLIDAAEDGRTTASYLHAERLSVDALILTHLHTDHALGVKDIVAQGIPVKTCYLPADWQKLPVDEEVRNALKLLEDSGTEIRTLSRGDTITLEDCKLTALWPEAGRVRPGNDANLYSLCLRLQKGETFMLLAGDLDGRYEMYAAEAADILKAAHHGSKSSTSEAFLEKVHPSVILLSCKDETRDTAIREKAGEAKVYATRTGGAITVLLDKEGYTVMEYIVP